MIPRLAFLSCSYCSSLPVLRSQACAIGLAGTGFYWRKIYTLILEKYIITFRIEHIPENAQIELI